MSQSYSLVHIATVDVLVQDTTGATAPVQNAMVTISKAGVAATAVGYTLADGHCVFKSTSTLPFKDGETVQIAVSDPTGVLQAASSSQVIPVSLAASSTIPTKAEYVFSVSLTNSITSAAVAGLLVQGTSGSFSGSLYSSTSGLVVFRAKNKNFDLNSVFSLTITDASGAFVSQNSVSITLSGGSQQQTSTI